MKIALIQTNPQDQFTENLQKSIELISKSAEMGADVVVLPEVFLFMGPDVERKKFRHKIGEGVFSTLQSCAQSKKIYLIAGTIDETNETHQLADESQHKFYNTCVTFNPDGQIVSEYRKLHLFNLIDEQGKPLYCESDVFKSGARPQTYSMTIENSKPSEQIKETWNALNIICYDIRFPEIVRTAKTQPDIIFIPAAFTWQTGRDHWEILLRARAIENQCFVVACNQTGFSHGGQKRNYGNSMVIDPWGQIVARLDESEDILFCYISKEEIVKSRAKLPALKDRKIF